MKPVEPDLFSPRYKQATDFKFHIEKDYFSLNEIHESVFELSCTQVKTYDSGSGGRGEISTDFRLGI